MPLLHRVLSVRSLLHRTRNKERVGVAVRVPPTVLANLRVRLKLKYHKAAQSHVKRLHL